jgi:hypothetical protein
MFYSELHFEIPSLLGVYIRVHKQSQWKWRFDRCASELQRYSQISGHMMEDHPEDEKKLIQQWGD